MQRDAFSQFVAGHPAGTKLRVRVTDVQPIGAFCELAPGVEGLLVAIDVEGSPRRMTFPDDYPRVGDSLEVTIEYIDHEARDIWLTQRPAVLPRSDHA
jgi:ribosomal protein S1